MINDYRKMLLDALEQYKTPYSEEQQHVKNTTEFIKKNEDCFSRLNLLGHVNGSAWILSPNGEKALLTHHKKLGKWFQLGGHSDDNPNTWQVAMKEAIEESGISAIQFVTKEIFDVDAHVIPENAKKGEPEHIHYDIRFLLQAQKEDVIISDESNDLKWVSPEELIAMKSHLSQDIFRMLNKWQSRGRAD